MLAYPEYPHGHCVFLHSRIFAFLPQNQRRRPPPLPLPGYGPDINNCPMCGTVLDGSHTYDMPPGGLASYYRSAAPPGGILHELRGPCRELPEVTSPYHLGRENKTTQKGNKIKKISSNLFVSYQTILTTQTI